MARKILNRKELRETHEAAERAGTDAQPVADKKAPAKRKSRAKAKKEVRLKAFWGVFTQSLNPVVMFEYSQRADAETRAAELTQSRNSPHFVQLVKKIIEE